MELATAKINYEKTILTDKFLEKYKTARPNWGFNGLGEVVYKRTYSRVKDNGDNEEWWETVARCVNGAQEIGAEYSIEEAERLYDHVFNLRCNFAGRMLWQLGTGNWKRYGANAYLNCWFRRMNTPESFCFLFENSMLGGGVGYSVRREDVFELPKVHEGVKITHTINKDSDFIIPDSREGWINLLRKVLRSYFVNGKCFSYSTILVRSYGEKINGFGGTASGPGILVDGITNICKVMEGRAGKKLRSIDVLDICNIIGSIVVAGNVRRSAQIALGDPDDYLFIRAKRWDLGNVPNWRALSNNTIYADDFTHISNDIWDGYAGNGEPYGLFNVKLSRKMGRLGEAKKDNCDGTNPCFVGNTLVAVADGRNAVRIDELAKWSNGVYKFPVYSAHRTGNRWVSDIQMASAFSTGTKEVITLVLSNGDKVECTENHNIALEDGSYIEAKDSKGLNIQNFYTSFTKYRHINSVTNGYAKQHRMIWEYYNGEIPRGYAIDHIDNDKGDSIHNLQMLTVQAHDKKTGIERLGKNNPVHKIKDKVEWVKRLSIASQTNNPNSSGLSDLDLINIGRVVLSHGKTLNKENCRKINSKFPKAFSQNRFNGKWKYFSDVVNNKTAYIAPIVPVAEVKNDTKVKPNKITVVDVIYTGKVEEVFDLTVENNHNFYIITSGDKEYKDSIGLLVHNCAEISLADAESCNLCELYINNMTSKEQLIDCSKLLYKTQKAICALPFLHEETNKIVHKNMRIGQGITGICQSLDKLAWLDEAYKELKKFDIEWSKKRGWNESIKLTTVKPSGTLSLLAGSTPGVHPAFSRHYIRRVRMASDDKLVEKCKEAGYHVEYAIGFDGTADHKTSIVSFPCYAGENAILAKDMKATDQLNLVKRVQTDWADNAVSVTVYYKKEELPDIKEWLKKNYKDSVKSVSFLLHSEHGFKQAPYEEITEAQYKELSSKIKQVKSVTSGDNLLDDCAGGSCPIK